MKADLNELNRKEIGERIKARRKMLNMSRAELGKKISVSQKTIANIEYGEKGMALPTLYKLKQVLGVSVDYILEGDRAFRDDAEKRQMLNENILSSLSVCSLKQLGCMESFARIYVESVVNRD